MQVSDGEVEREWHQGRDSGCSGGGREMRTEPTPCSVTLSVWPRSATCQQALGRGILPQNGQFPPGRDPRHLHSLRGTEDMYEILHHTRKYIRQKEKLSDPLV